MRTRELGGLKVHLVGFEPETPSDAPVVVLCHGFGASGDDLVPIGSAVRTAQRVRWVFPEAPLKLPREFGGAGRMWWPIDVAALERAMVTGVPRDLAESEPAGLDDAVRALTRMLDALEQEYGVPTNRVLVGGFSQGAMLACELFVSGGRETPGLAMLSGTLLARLRWSEAMKTRAGKPVFVSHGTHDQVLPFKGAEALVEALRAAGVEVDFVPFRGVHEVPAEVVHGLTRYLDAVFPKT